MTPGNEDVRIEDVDVDVAINGLDFICVLLEEDVACNVDIVVNGLELICVLLEEDVAGNDDTLEPGNEDVRIEDVDVDIAVNELELI